MRQSQKSLIGMLAVLLLLFTSAASKAIAEKKSTASEVLAKVNGVEITKTSLDQELAVILPQLAQSGRPAPTAAQMQDLKKNVLEGLIDGEVLYQTSVKQGIAIDDAAVSKKMSDFKSQFATDEEFQKALTSLNTTEEELQARLKRNMAIQELLNKEVEDKVKVDDQKAKAFYDANVDKFKQPEQVKASHILITVKADADQATKDEALKKIKSIQEKIKKGEDFAALAKEYSQGPSNVRGGDLGYFIRGQMVKPFEDAAFSLKPGEVSDVVETQFGYHLIKVIDKKPESTVSFDEIKPKLLEFLKKQEMEKAMDAYIDNLKKDADITRVVTEKE